jgi:hypothetical protein
VTTVGSRSTRTPRPGSRAPKQGRFVGMEEAGSPMDDLPFQKVCELLKLLQETCGKNAKDRRRRLLDRFHLKLIPPGRWEARPAWPFQRVASGRLPSQPTRASPLPAARLSHRRERTRHRSTGSVGRARAPCAPAGSVCPRHAPCSATCRLKPTCSSPPPDTANAPASNPLGPGQAHVRQLNRSVGGGGGARC